MASRDPASALTGVVLAGGRSTRFGRDKATLEFGGQRLVDRVGGALASVCNEVLVASGNGRRLDVPWRQVADVVSGVGPLAGIVAALEVAGTPLVAVAAVDLPYAEPAVFLELAALWGGEVAVVPEAGGRLQPLHAVWARDAASRLREALDAGARSPSALAVDLGARIVPASDLPRQARHGRFAVNVNRPEDLAGLGGGDGEPEGG